MRTFWLLTSVAAAIFLEWILQTWDFWGIAPPLIFGTVLFWFGRLSLQRRIWLGIAVGALLDGVSVFPFGTYIIAFFVLAVLVEFLKFFFTKPDAPLVKAMITGVPFFSFFILLSLNALLLEAFRIGSFIFADYPVIFLGAFWWMFWYVLAAVAGSWLKRRFL